MTLWPGELRPQVCIPRLSVALLFVCAWLSLGFGADDGTRTRDFHLGKVTLCHLSYIRTSRRPLPACGAALAPIDLTYECRRRVAVLSTHAVVISVTCCCWLAGCSPRGSVFVYL